MAAKASASLGLFLVLSLLFLALTSGCGTCPAPTPKRPKPTPKPSYGKCPVDTLKMATCTNVLNGLVAVGEGEFPKQPCQCCSLIEGLLDLEAAVCICTAIKANILGINLNVPINLSLLVNYCGKKIPAEFQCP